MIVMLLVSEIIVVVVRKTIYYCTTNDSTINMINENYTMISVIIVIMITINEKVCISQKV